MEPRERLQFYAAFQNGPALAAQSALIADRRAAIRRRIVIARSLYAAGAALSVIDTWWSIAFIFLVQINYAIAPPFPFGRKCA